MGSTTAYSKAKMPVFIAYRCSNCGKAHCYKYEIKTTGSSSQYGYANKERSAALKASAQAIAGGTLRFELMTLQTSLMTHDFSNAKVPDHRCKDCGCTESWMFPSYKALKTAAVIALICSLVGFMIFYAVGMQTDVDKLPRAFLWFVLFVVPALFYGAVGLFILRLILRHLAKKKISQRAASLTDRDMPLVGVDSAHFTAQALARFGTDPDFSHELMSL